MYQRLIGVVFLGLVLLPISVVLLAFVQNVRDEVLVKPKLKRAPVRTMSYYEENEVLLPAKLRIVK